MNHPASYLDQALEASVLTEAERERIREDHANALLLMAVELTSEDSEAPGYGGTEAGSDCPREAGSSHTRPEKFTEGARWLQDWRLP